jgi:hypothetical protein
VTPRQKNAWELYRMAIERLMTLKATEVRNASESKERWARICAARDALSEATDELDASIVDEMDDRARLVFEVSGRELV